MNSNPKKLLFICVDQAITCLLGDFLTKGILFLINNLIANDLELNY